ncbi:leucine-rich repeat protein [Anaerobutyricum hallii]|uniref:leucine-rich repeat protein n=4 Tax=Anaerobutyricum hallii TaxID=39488 RepID=UPI002ED96A0B
MRKKIYGIATALALAMGCGLFLTYPVQAAETQDVQQEESDYFTLPNGKKFLAIRKLKNGKTVKFYDLHAYTDGKAVYGKAMYDGEEFQVRNFDLEIDKGDFENPGYKESDKSTQIFSAFGKPETYFPALTATKKVNELINKYKDPKQHLLPEKVDKTSSTYQEMKAAAEEATKDCKTDYEKIVALTKYVKKIMTYDISLSGKGLTVEKAWEMKKGVCEQFGDIMERLVQIEGIPSVDTAWENKNNYHIGHAYVLSYDKDSQKWICCDPTGGNADLSVYSQAGQMTNVNKNVVYLKNNNAYYWLIYDKNDAYGNIDYDKWELMDRWGIVLHNADYSNSTDIDARMTDFDGIPVVGVCENAFFNDKEITSIKLSNNLERIENGAFWGASNLKTITFSDGGKGLKKIDSLAFKDCSSLESIDLSNAEITEIPVRAFENCTSLKSIKLPSTVTKIADNAFAGCSNLEEIKGLEQCKISELSATAFDSCVRLKDINLSNATIAAIPDQIFSGMRGLISATVPKTVTSIGTEAFYACKNLEMINGLSDCDITKIGEKAFYNCWSLKEADLSGSSLTVLPASAFKGDTALLSVKMPESLNEIGNEAFYGCSAMKKLDLNNTRLTTIGNSALSDMTSLMYINLPDTVNSVGAKAFDLNLRLDSSDTALMPTVVSENVTPASVNYTDNNVSPWKRRQVIFRDNAVAVHFDGNGSDGKTANAPVFASAGTKISIPACKYTKKGYLFTGWNTEKDGSGTTYKAGARTSDAVSILYAQWKKSTAKVTLEFPGGKYTNASGSTWDDSFSFTASFSSNSSVTYLPFAQNMTKEGCTFAGWYTEPEYKKRIESLTIRTAIDGMTLYAKWNDTHEHVWGKGAITTRPTCTTPGVKTYTCSVCQKTKTEEIPATGHQHTEVRNVKEATCKEEGYTGDTYCTDCGEKLSSGEPTAKKAHDWDEGKVTTEATCKNTGVKTYTCNNCSETKTEVIPMTDHIWDNGKVTTKPSCITPGVKTYTCTVCQETKTEEIPATGHQHTEVRNVKEATCTKEGYTGDTYCTDCGEKLSDGKILPKKDHDYEIKDHKDATCTEDGYTTSFCKNCGDEKKETIKATGHQHTEVRDAKKATCTKAGYTGDTYCKDCGEKISSGEVIAKLAHTWDEGNITKEADCKETGVMTYTCHKCGATKTEDIPRTEHTWDEGEVTTAPTCTKPGVRTYTCSVCKATRTEVIKATGHLHTEIRNKKDASCTENGYTGDTYCKDCEELLKKGETVDVLGHQWKETKRAEPSYTEDGQIIYTCNRCGEQKAETLEKLAYPKAGTKYTVAGCQYKVTKAGAEVSLIKTNKKAKRMTIPAVIKVNGVTYKVTSIGAKAFNGSKKLSKVTVGTNIKKISNNAFFKCRSLKTVTIKSVLLTKKTANKKAFKGISRKMVMKVPKKMKKVYVKIFKGLKVK